MAHGKRLSTEEYNKIKMFVTEGIPISTVMKITGRSWATIKLIQESTDQANYIHLQKVKNGYITPDGKRIDRSAKYPKTNTVAEEEQVSNQFKEISSADQIVTSVNNLTEAVITMTAVAREIATQMAIDKSKSFLRR